MFERLMIAAAVFAAGASVGGVAAWKTQGHRLAAVKAEYAGFKATTQAEGMAAKAAADKAIIDDKAKKDKSDHDYQTIIDKLTTDALRLRNARSSSRYVPAAPAGSVRPELACFDRTELERALQSLDDGLSGLIDQGDTSNAGLTIARQWAAGLRKN